MLVKLPECLGEVSERQQKHALQRYCILALIHQAALQVTIVSGVLLSTELLKSIGCCNYLRFETNSFTLYCVILRVLNNLVIHSCSLIYVLKGVLILD